MLKPSSPQEFREQGYGQFDILSEAAERVPKGETSPSILSPSILSPSVPGAKRPAHSGNSGNSGNSGINRLYGRPDTCSPSFLIIGKFRVEGNRAYFVKGEGYAYVKINPGQVTLNDVKHMVRELELIGTTKKEVELRDALYRDLPCSVEEFRKRTDCDLDSRCDYFRLDFEASLKVAFEKQKGIRELKGSELRDLYEMLQKTPWKLWFTKFCEPLKEMTYKGWNTYAARFKRAMPPMMMTALRLYTFVKEKRLEGNDIFPIEGLFQAYLRDPHWRDIAYGYNDERYLEAALEFLCFHAFEVPLEGYLCFPKDVNYNRIILEGLRFIKDNGEPALRDNGLVPCMPSATLSEDQLRVIRHAHANQLTLLQGGPGTGKTEVLVALMASFKKPLVVTYVGMMVDALQGRFGKRTETAHTIHYVCCLKEFAGWGAQALRAFDMLIVDEGSNMDAHLFSRLLNAISGYATRLVIVGDLGQIFPISPGCPFYDLIQCYPQCTFHLTENKRVDPDSRALADASRAITEGREVEFSHGGALRFWAFEGDLAGAAPPLNLLQSNSGEKSQRLLPTSPKDYLARALLDYVGNLQDTMEMQIVVLRNSDRKILNTLTEEILLERGVLQPTRQVNVGGTLYYAGKKVIFTKNTKPIVDEEGQPIYDGVRNGELGQVKRVETMRDGTLMELTNGKRILISPLRGVDPFHVQPGYATTANKSQGSEWDNVLFWIYPKPLPFSREYAYVAISRARKRCIVVGRQEDFRYLCSWKARPRETLLRHFLPTLEMPLKPSDHIVLPAREGLKLLPPDVPAVPLLVAPAGKGERKTTKKGKGSFAIGARTKGKP